MSNHYETMPTVIKVGYKDVSIEKWSGASVLANRRYGEFSAAECSIRIAQGLTPPEAANTLLHEVLHAIWFVFSIPDGRPDDREEILTEEKAVSSVTNGICTVMRDNPALFTWIQNCLQ